MRFIILKRFQGQGLIEVVMVFLIISGSVVALLRFQNNLAYTNNLTQQENTALLLATQQIETLRDFTTLTGANSYQTITTGTKVTAGINTTYTTAWTITEASNPSYKTLDVKVSWPDRNGTSQNIRLVTQVAALDPMYSSAIM